MATPVFLAHGDQATLEAHVAGGLKFSDIFDAATFDKASGKCLAPADKTYRLVNAGFGTECLRLKVGNELKF